MTTSCAPRRRVIRRCLLIVAGIACATACTTACTTDGVLSTPTTTTSTTTTSSTTTSTTTTVPPTTTPPPLVTTGASVLVANASSVDGAAAVLTDDLRTAGFTVADPTNGFGIDADLATSKIYVAAGGEDVARSISRLMGGVPLFEMPTPVWVSGGSATLGDATVVVMLGRDLAGLHLGEMAPVFGATTTTAG